MKMSRISTYVSYVLAIAISAVTVIQPGVSMASDVPTLPTQHVDINFQNEMWASAFSQDDTNFFFAEIGLSGIHQILTSELAQSGQPIPANSDGMASFRTRIGDWQNADLYFGQGVGPSGHHWLYGAAGNCAVVTGTCQSAPSQGGVWAIDTDAQNTVSSIPLLRANGEGQDGQVFGVTGTPNGKYIYALAGKGGHNTGAQGKQLFKIDAKTNMQIGQGVPVPFAWDRIYASDQYVYGLSAGQYLKVKIDGDSTQLTGDSAAETLNITSGTAPDLAWADAATYSLQGNVLLSGASLNMSCSTSPGQIGLVDVTTGVSKVLDLGQSVFPVYPVLGGDETVYTFDLCSSRVLQLDADTGAVISRTTPFPSVGSLNGIWPFGVISHDLSKYVVGGERNGGLIEVNTNPPRIPSLRANPSLSGTGLQGTNVAVSIGSWSASPAAKSSLQWFRCEKAVRTSVSTFSKSSKCIAIPGAIKATYRLKIDDADRYLTVLEKASNTVGSVSISTVSLHAPKLSAPKGKTLPTITGSAAAGKVLTVRTGTWTANPVAKTSSQWYRCDTATKAKASPVPGSCASISGANKVRYKLTAADKGKFVTVRVTALNTQGSAMVTAKSQHVAQEPTVSGAPTISGSEVVSRTLTATKGTWLAFPTAKTEIVWYRCASPTAEGAKKFSGSSRCVAISRATKTRYRLTADDQGKYLSVLVTATNKAGTRTVTAKSTGQIGQTN